MLQLKPFRLLYSMARKKAGKPNSKPRCPGPTEAELRDLLIGLKIETGEVGTGDKATLQTLIRRALSKAQHLSYSNAKNGGVVDPSALSR